MDNIFAGIKALLVNLSNLYAADVIFKGFNNNYPIPADNTFIIMNILPNIHSHCLLPVYNYDDITEEETWSQLDEASFQVDFYGVNAVTASAKFRAALQSGYGTRFLQDEGYQCVVGIVKDTQNLTDIIDRDMYTQRYAVLFTIQFNNILTVDTPGFDEADIDVIFADIQKPTPTT